MTISAQDAHSYPIYNARFRLIVPLLDADGDPVSPSSPDTELSQDMGTFADATNEATEIATSSGVIYVDLIATELDTKSTVVRVQSTGAKTTIAVLNPRRLPILRAGTAQAGANSTVTLDASASAIDDYYVGCYVNITNDTPSGALGQARVIVDYVGSTKVATIEGTWGTNPSSSSTFEILLTAESQFRQSNLSAILGTAVSTPATAGILDVNVKNIDNDAASASGTVTFPNATIASTTNITGGTVTTATNVTTVNGLAASVITATSIAADAITDAKVASDVTIASVTGAVGSVTGLTAATVHADLDDIQARLPAALTAGGNMKSDVLAISSDATAADNAEAFFDGTGYAGTGNVIPTVTTTTTATNVTTVNGLAANTLTASALAADAVTEIQAGLSTVTTAQVKAEVLDVLNVDTFAEPTGAPAATTTLAGKIGRIYQALRNKATVTSSSKAFFSDAGASLWTKGLSDNGTTYTEDEGA